MRGFNWGKATRAFAEAGVMNETGVVGDTTPLKIALTAILTKQQFIHLPRR